MDWLVYMIECDNGSYYTGVTNNLERRLAAHKSGRGAKYFLMNRIKQLVFQETGHTRSSALIREAQIKKLKRDQKTTLIKQNLKKV